MSTLKFTILEQHQTLETRRSASEITEFNGHTYDTSRLLSLVSFKCRFIIWILQHFRVDQLCGGGRGGYVHVNAFRFEPRKIEVQAESQSRKQRIPTSDLNTEENADIARL